MGATDARMGKALAVKPDELSLIPWTHMVEGENSPRLSKGENSKHAEKGLAPDLVQNDSLGSAQAGL